MRFLPSIHSPPPYSYLKSRSPSKKGYLQEEPTTHSSDIICKPIHFLHNENYLLRLCNNLEWYNVEKCLSTMMNVLTDADSTFSPSDKPGKHHRKELFHSCQQQLLATDQWDNTSLHLMCYLKPSAVLIRLLLDAADKAQVLELLTKRTNRRDQTALLVACNAHGSHSLIHELLLRDALTVTVPDKDGKYPFDGVIMGYEMMRKLPMYKEQCLPLEQVDTPAVGSSSTTSFSKQLQEKDDNSTITISSQKVMDGAQIFSEFWNTIEDLLRATWQSHFPKEPWISAIHAATIVADCLPSKLADLLLRVGKNEYFLATKTSSYSSNSTTNSASSASMIPLYRCLLRIQSIMSSEKLQNSQQVRDHRRQAHFLQQLIAMDPEAVLKVPLSPRLLFSQAVSSGLSWNIAATTSVVEGQQEEGSLQVEIVVDPQQQQQQSGALQVLFQQIPVAIRQKDPKTGLYPFQLAAAVSSFSAPDEKSLEKEDEDDEEVSLLLSLDTIYNLLRPCPELILWR